MATWIEYVAATVIAGFLAVLLFTVQARSQQASLDSVQYRTAKTSTMDLVAMIEQDLKNLGSQHPGTPTVGQHALPGGAGFGIVSPPDSLSTPRTFSFYAQIERGQPPRLIRYEWAPDGSVTLSDGTARTTYRLTRRVDGTIQGQSFGTITRLNIWLLEDDGKPITNIPETRQVYVELHAVSPLGTARTIEETRWSTVFRPLALTIGAS